MLYLPPTSCIGSILSTAVVSTSVPVSTVTSLCSVNLTPGVWSMTANNFYAAGSGTVTMITCVYASFSTSATLLDTMYSTRIPCVSYCFGTTATTYLNIPITRYVATILTQTYYLLAYCTGTGTFNAHCILF